MESDTDAVFDEVKALRRGLGAQTPKIGELVGPNLRAVCRVEEGDSHSTIRKKVVRVLRGLCAKIPGHLNTVAEVTLALDGDQGRFLGHRVEALAKRYGANTRTIRRRMDNGHHLIAESALELLRADEPRTGDSWYVDRFVAVLRLDTAAPESLQTRRIVVEEDGLDRITVSMTVPQPDRGDAAPEVHVEPYFGAVLVSTRRHGDRRFSWELDLPSRMDAGDRHEFALLARFPEGQPIQPHFLFFPERACESFDLRVRFDPALLPKSVRRVAGVFHRDVDSLSDDDEVISLDRANEVRLRFTGLRPGFGYGARWGASQTCASQTPR